MPRRGAASAAPAAGAGRPAGGTALLLLLLGIALPAARPAAAEESARARPQSQPATRPATPPRARVRPATKVWTLADLERLRRESRGTVTYAGVTTPSIALPTPEPATGPSPTTLLRYQEMVTQAHAAIARLERERLAMANPFLRGLARDAEGRPTAPRPIADIDAEIQEWRNRERLARTSLVRAAQLTGRPVEELLPPSPSSAPDPGRD